MIKYFESSIIYQFKWDQVVRGYWQRYPNPKSGHVLTEDTISREVKNGMLYTKRLLTKTNGWIKGTDRFLSKNIARLVEESIVDPKAKTLTTYTRNFTLTKILTVVEKIVYRVSDENPNWTVAQRSMWLESHFFGFSRFIVSRSYERLKKNCSEMFVGFNYVLAHMFPQTAQSMNPSLAQMGFTDMPKEIASAKGSLTEDLQHSLHDRAEKMKDVAKKATDLAKKKAGPIYVACQGNGS